MRRWPAVLAVALVAPSATIGCGNSNGSKPDPVEGAGITKGVRPPSETEVTNADITRYKDDTASRAFMRFWSQLQYQDWIGAIDRYSPGLQRVVGERNMLGAFKFQAAFYRSAKPVVRTEARRRGLTVVCFTYADGAGKRKLSSTTWRREGDRWTLVFDALLDEALQSWAQSRVQQRTAPNSPRPTKEALRAGIEASELQGRYLPFLRAQPATCSNAADAG
jgi:hypothetical protein